MKRIGPGAASALLLSCLFGTLANAASINDDIQQGMGLFLKAQYIKADQVLDDALQQNPNDPLAQLWKGLAEAALQRPFASKYFLQGTDELVGGAATDLLVFYDWHQGSLQDAKQVLYTCMHGDVRWRASCEDIKRGIESGAGAPAVKDWPADSGLIKITTARATVWKPTPSQ